MTGQNRFKRLLILSHKKTSMVLCSLRPGAVRGRFIGPKVLMNSIPKSGTNLLENTLFNLPSLREGLTKTLRGWDRMNEKTLAKIRGLKKGQFLVAHLPAHPELLSIVHDKGIRSLLMVRDPRDIVVSHFQYVTHIDLTHICHPYFASLPDDDARLMASIKGVLGLHSPIDEVLNKFKGWLDDCNTLIVRFEDLVGPGGGGDAARQFQTVRDITVHLGIAMSEEKIKDLASKIFSAKTPTFRSGRIGGWKKFFKPEHIQAFKELAGDMLITYGYERDLNW